MLSGRGFGKTRIGGEFVQEEVEAGRAKRAALIAPTAGDARHVMVMGESGIMQHAHPAKRPVYEPSNRMLIWPTNVTGVETAEPAIAYLYSAEEPDRLRGPQHDLAWLDELSSWKRMRETYDNVQFGLRLGERPRQIITTTGKPRRLLVEIKSDPHTVTTTGTTYDNVANLAPAFLRKVRRKYEGTRLGRQELLGELLMDVPGALWNREMIENTRWRAALPKLRRIVVAIDPAVSRRRRSAETGIVTAGVARMFDGKDHLFVFADDSGKVDADEWAKRGVRRYRDEKADVIVGEVNQGGDLVQKQIWTFDKNANFKMVHATRGKRKRAEPVSALWEQRRAHIVGSLPELEDQMCSYVPDDQEIEDDDEAEEDENIGRSDEDASLPVDETGAIVPPTYVGGYDRADAMVWVATELVVDAWPERDFSEETWGLKEQIEQKLRKRR